MYLRRVKELREDSDTPQKVIAEYLGVKQNTYSDYENGKIKIPLEAMRPFVASQYPAISFSIVDLPEPDGPTKAVIVPGLMERLIPCNTSCCLS